MGRSAHPAATAGDAFLDFGALLPGLRARLEAGQARRLAAMMEAEPGVLPAGGRGPACCRRPGLRDQHRRRP